MTASPNRSIRRGDGQQLFVPAVSRPKNDLLCNDSGERLIRGSTVGRCKECNGTRQHLCDVCGGTGEIEGDPQAA